MSTYPREQRYPPGPDARIERNPTASASPSPGASRPRGTVTTRQRAEDQRQAKLELVRQQVKSGSLVIRQMTAEERSRFPPRAARPSQGRGRRSR